MAPFDSPASTAGPLRWPWILPFPQPEESNTRRQAAAFDALAAWAKPAHVVFDVKDSVFTEEWGRQFAAHIPGATFTAVAGEGHRPLLWTGGRDGGKHRGAEFAELVLRLISEE